MNKVIVVVALMFAIMIGVVATEHNSGGTTTTHTVKAKEVVVVQEKTLVEMCVDGIVAIYNKYGLPFTKPVGERAAYCTQWMADNNITTKAQLIVALQEADNQLRDVFKK